MKYILTILIVLFTASMAGAGTLTSDPSPQNATHWKITLSNSTVYSGETCNYTVCGIIDNLGTGSYTGTAQFGIAEWELTSEGTTNSTGMVGSTGTPFDLKRRGKSDKQPHLKVEE